MALGCPVVAANRTSIPEVCGDAAVLVDPDDVPALAGGLHRALHDEELRATLVERGSVASPVSRGSRAASETLSLLAAAARAVG